VSIPLCPVAKIATTPISIKNSAILAITENAKTMPQKILHPAPFLAGLFVGGLALRPDTGPTGCGSIGLDILLSCSKSIILPFKKST
jgi:hypothetical protein